MARNKAIFDADILINLVKTNSFEYLSSQFEQIYVSDYVWKHEIKEGTDEKKFLKKQMNQVFLVLLDFQKMTPTQQRIYKEAYKILNHAGLSDYVNEGEKITASFAKAHNVAYYMSDDNKAAPYIKSFTDVAVINYCDLLFIAFIIHEEDLVKIEAYYKCYLDIFVPGRLPKLIQGKDGSALEFAMIMAKCSDKFEKNKKLKALVDLLLHQ